MSLKILISIIFFFLSLSLQAKDFICPIESCVKKSSLFGVFKHPLTHKYRVHTGVDFPLKKGSKVFASSSGKVIKSGNAGGYGLRIMIKHKDGIETLYAHLSKIFVKNGDIVKKGEIIGYSGNTGLSSGPHLHFGLYINDKYKDPLKYIE